MSVTSLHELVEIAELVTRARSAVERDRWSRDIAFTPMPEMPPRFSRQLVALAEGIALASGHTAVTDEDIRRVARVGLDGIPPVRRACLEHLAVVRGPSTVTAVAAHLGCSISPARYTLQDLRVLELTVSQRGPEGPDTRWRLSPTHAPIVVRWLGRGQVSTPVLRAALHAKAVTVLTILRQCAHGQAPLRDIREQAGLPERTCQRVMSRLVKDGYASRPAGTRGVYQMTAAGRELIEHTAEQDQ